MKAKWVIGYSCSSSWKPLCIFYGILYGIVLIGYACSAVLGREVFRFSGVEISCLIFLGIFGNLGFREDFRYLLQNGFTRKMIFCGNISVFAFCAVLMSGIDTGMAVLLRQTSGYESLFQSIYGIQSPVFQWIWLFFLYFNMCFLSYLLTLLCNKVGKKIFWILMLLVLVVLLLFLPFLAVEQILPREWIAGLGNGIARLAGFGSGGIQFAWPFLTGAAAAALLGGVSFLMLRLTENK